MNIDYDSIRARNPLPEYCERRGIQLRRSGGSLVGKCPLHNERHGAAFVVFDDGHWRCFGKCGKSGDVVDLEQAIAGGTLAEAAERLGAERMQGAGTFVPKLAKQPVHSCLTKDNPFGLPHRMSKTEINLCVEAATRLVGDEALIEKVAKWRNWKPETIRNLALEPSLGIEAGGKLCFLYDSGCKLRWRDGGERRIRWAFGKPWLWRAGFIKQAATVFIAEGESDAVTLLDAGVEQDAKTLVIALPSASFHVDQWSALFAGKRAVIATDADQAGTKAAEHLAGALTPFAASVDRLELERIVSG
jgi:5S rRNA maturation endonuclease (ribonuclease M5)